MGETAKLWVHGLCGYTWVHRIFFLCFTYHLPVCAERNLADNDQFGVLQVPPKQNLPICVAIFGQRGKFAHKIYWVANRQRPPRTDTQHIRGQLSQTAGTEPI
ncbi:unnamed protein product [Ectocarpus sp. 12 AP-2014]